MVHLAAHGLSDGGDLVGGGRFRLGQAHGGLGHRGRGKAQVLSTAHKERDGNHCQNGQGDNGGKRCKIKALDKFGDREAFGKPGAVAQGGNQAHPDQPEQGGGNGEPDRGV